MTRQRMTLEDAICAALLHHADQAHLPLSVPHVRAQAATAAKAARIWSAARNTEPDQLYRSAKPGPPEDQPAPAAPTGPVDCHRDDCKEPAVGWRWYVARKWQAACRRHINSATSECRRYNTELAGGAE